MTNASMVAPTRRVEMWFAGTAQQNRLTVAFRIILAIPQFIVLGFVGIAAFVVVVIGWFAALIMGRLPEWAHAFLCGVARWYTRVGAYMFLLTDRYPPFSLDDVEYPARPILPERGPLNRVSVFFRIILAVPASVFYEIVQYGLTVPLLLVMWFVVLITGRMPPALYDAYAALLRYEVRFHAWFVMLTSEYAWGMLGDTAPPPAFAAPPPAFAPPPFDAPPAAPPAPAGFPAAPPSPPPTTQAPPTQATPAPTPFSYPTTPGEQVPTPEPDAAAPPSEPDAAAPPSEPVSPAPGWPPAQPPPALPPPGWPPAQPPPAPPAYPPGAMPPPSSWERISAVPPGEALPPWGTLVLQGAARGWMVFAIVWGSILFVGQNIAQNIEAHHRNDNGQVTANADAAPHAHAAGPAVTVGH